MFEVISIIDLNLLSSEIKKKSHAFKDLVTSLVEFTYEAL